jgi:hypothetical protein
VWIYDGMSRSPAMAATPILQPVRRVKPID